MTIRVRTDDDESEPIDYDSVVKTTELAKGFKIDGKVVWVPKSQITDEDEEENVVFVKSWWAIKEGLV